MGLIADEHPLIAYALDATGRTHGKGMQSHITMMAVRLLELRRVLMRPRGSRSPLDTEGGTGYGSH